MKTVLILIIAAAMVACGSHTADSRLADIASIVADRPHDALQRLDSINPPELTEADRHYFDLLSIKARDKAYINHTSDSLILDAIDYYASHPGDHNLLYAEALYYGGRVYSDLGDYPTSLRYFQSALDQLPADSQSLLLRGTVLSQTGRLLNKIRLYNRAIPYLEESIRIDSILNDSINLMYDKELLGAICLHVYKYDVALCNFIEAKSLAEKVLPSHVYTLDMYLAAIKYKQGQPDSTLEILRPVFDKLHPLERNAGAYYMAGSYMGIGQVDSAYKYAQELAFGAGSYNRPMGFDILLNPALKHLVPIDSVYSYVKEYSRIMERTLNQNQTQEALIQNTRYNYDLHERERQKAEEKQDTLKHVIIVITFIALLLLIIILYIKNRNQHHLLQLRKELDSLSKLRQSLIQPTEPQQRPKENKDYNDLREQLKNELLEIQRIGNIDSHISPVILQSEAYTQLQQHIANDKIIPEANPLWTDLEKVVLEASKDFKYHLQLLTGGKLKPSDYHIALLIKCGISPTHMSILVGRTKGTISYRREALCEKVFGQKLGVKVIDDIIRAL